MLRNDQIYRVCSYLRETVVFGAVDIGGVGEGREGWPAMGPGWRGATAAAGVCSSSAGCLCCQGGVRGWPVTDPGWRWATAAAGACSSGTGCHWHRWWGGGGGWLAGNGDVCPARHSADGTSHLANGSLSAVGVVVIIAATLLAIREAMPMFGISLLLVVTMSLGPGALSSPQSPLNTGGGRWSRWSHAAMSLLLAGLVVCPRSGWSGRKSWLASCCSLLAPLACYYAEFESSWFRGEWIGCGLGFSSTSPARSRITAIWARPQLDGHVCLSSLLEVTLVWPLSRSLLKSRSWLLTTGRNLLWFSLLKAR